MWFNVPNAGASSYAAWPGAPVDTAAFAVPAMASERRLLPDLFASSPRHVHQVALLMSSWSCSASKNV